MQPFGFLPDNVRRNIVLHMQERKKKGRLPRKFIRLVSRRYHLSRDDIDDTANTESETLYEISCQK